MADRVGVLQQTIQRIETGKHSPSFKTVQEIAEAMECRVVIVEKSSIE